MQEIKRILYCFAVAEKLVLRRVNYNISAVGKSPVLVDKCHPYIIMLGKYPCKLFFPTAVLLALEKLQKCLFFMCEFTHICLNSTCKA